MQHAYPVWLRWPRVKARIPNTVLKKCYRIHELQEDIPDSLFGEGLTTHSTGLDGIVQVTSITVLHVHASDGFVMSFPVNETTKIFDDIGVPVLPQYLHLELGSTIFDVCCCVSLLDALLPGRLAFDDEHTSIEATVATNVFMIQLLELQPSE